MKENTNVSDLTGGKLIVKNIFSLIGNKDIAVTLRKVVCDESEQHTNTKNTSVGKDDCISNENSMYEVLIQSLKNIDVFFDRYIARTRYELRTDDKFKVEYKIPISFSQALALAAKQAECDEQNIKFIDIKY